MVLRLEYNGFYSGYSLDKSGLSTKLLQELKKDEEQQQQNDYWRIMDQKILQEIQQGSL